MVWGPLGTCLLLPHECFRGALASAHWQGRGGPCISSFKTKQSTEKKIICAFYLIESERREQGYYWGGRRHWGTAHISVVETFGCWVKDGYVSGLLSMKWSLSLAQWQISVHSTVFTRIRAKTDPTLCFWSSQNNYPTHEEDYYFIFVNQATRMDVFLFVEQTVSLTMFLKINLSFLNGFRFAEKLQRWYREF